MLVFEGLEHAQLLELRCRLLNLDLEVDGIVRLRWLLLLGRLRNFARLVHQDPVSSELLLR